MADDRSTTINRRTTDAKLEKSSPDDRSSNFMGDGAAPKLTYTDFAWLAETLDGRRNEDVKVTMVQENGRPKLVVRERDYQLAPGETLVLNGIRTDTAIQGRPEVTNLTFSVGEASTTCITDEGLLCDAVFCSESAIEKFVFPYYRSQRLLDETEWAQVKTEFENPSTIAIGHAHPSRRQIFKTGTPPIGSFYVLGVERDNKGLVTELKWRNLGTPDPA